MAGKFCHDSTPFTALSLREISLVIFSHYLYFQKNNPQKTCKCTEYNLRQPEEYNIPRREGMQILARKLPCIMLNTFILGFTLDTRKHI